MPTPESAAMREAGTKTIIIQQRTWRTMFILVGSKRKSDSLMLSRISLPVNSFGLTVVS